MSKEVEKRTEAIARIMAQEAGQPAALMELFLHEAYKLLYFGDKKELARIEAKSKAKRKKGGRKK